MEEADLCLKPREDEYAVKKGNKSGKQKASRWDRVVRCAKSNLLLILTLTGVIFGVGLGFTVRQYELTQEQISYLSFLGELFMRALKMLMLPLIMSSIVAGLAGTDARLSGKLGLRAILYYLTTTVIAVSIGIIMAATIQPGGGIQTGTSNNSIGTDAANEEPTIPADSFLDLLRNMIPENVVQATSEQYRTERVIEKKIKGDEKGDGNETVVEVVKLVGGYHKGPNVLGIITFSAIFGIFLGTIGDEGDVVKKFFFGFNEVIMRMVSFIIWCSPLGIASLIAGKIAEVEDLEEVMAKLGLYVATVLTGTLFHGFIVLPLIYFITTRKNPFKFIAGMSQALLTAWATASSSATLPVTFKCAEERNKVDKRVTRFMLPIGATVNMDGGGVYDAVSALFIAQMHGFAVDFGTILTISAAATASSIGSSGVPHGSLVTIIIVLHACGLPVTDIPLLLAVDWLLDRFRTMINVFGDSIGAAVVAHLSQKELSSSKYADTTSSEESLSSGSETSGKSEGLTTVDSVNSV